MRKWEAFLDKKNIPTKCSIFCSLFKNLVYHHPQQVYPVPASTREMRPSKMSNLRRHSVRVIHRMRNKMNVSSNGSTWRIASTPRPPAVSERRPKTSTSHRRCRQRSNIKLSVMHWFTERENVYSSMWKTHPERISVCESAKCHI